MSVTIPVLNNVSSPDGPHSFTLISATLGDFGGSVTVNADGTVSYDPRDVAAGTATDTFRYTFRDNANGMDGAGTVTIQLTPPELNWIEGTDDRDVLVGTAGRDLLIPGAGADILTGGAGADIFKFTQDFATDSHGVTYYNGGQDTVTDFGHAQGDKLELTVAVIH